jgi:hypothetical protein
MKFHALMPGRKFLIAACAASAAAALISGPGPASATTAPALLYNYQFTGTTGTVVNSAPDGPQVSLKLDGTWSSVKSGVKFSGNTTGHESVAYGEPTSGDTIDEPATAAIGFGTRIQYESPAGGTCFKGTPNITQIGLFSSKPAPAQVKLQFSNCGTSSTQVMAECRFAGSLTKDPSTDPPVVSTVPLVGGDVYTISCIKSADHSGKATITLSVTPLKTGLTTTDTFTVNAVGSLKTNQYISAGNKYPLPAPADNTNQFNGIMTSTVYCAGTGTQVSSCLAANLPVK